MKIIICMALSCILGLVAALGIAWAQSAPQVINYQGRLSDAAGLPPADGETVDLTFSFYGVETGLTPLYLSVIEEDVVINGGLFLVLIGSGAITPGTESSLAAVFARHQDVWMGIKADGDAEMTPRSRISSVPYALTAGNLDLASLYSTALENPDLDGDGYRSILASGNDCNDGNSVINPGASEICDDGIDNNCDAYTDHQDLSCGIIGPMAKIPAGCFMMGDAFGEGDVSEVPVHNVCITSDFQIDVHVTTNKEYKACVDAGACTAPLLSSSNTRGSYYGDPSYDNFPVIYVDWGQAHAYCSWAGKRLPTEAEWEYSARGGLAGQRYPWGNTITGADANYFGSGDPWDDDTSPVEYYAPNGYGIYDMSGNVDEWVNDYFYDGYYGISPLYDPPGPVGGTHRVLRSGGWNSSDWWMRVSYRRQYDPVSQSFAVGIRCVRD